MTIKHRIRIALSLMTIMPFILMIVAIMVIQFGFGNMARPEEMGHQGWGGGHGGNGVHLFVLCLLATVLAGGGLLSWWISSSILKPLAVLRQAAQRIGDGDLDFTVPAGKKDELGDLSSVFETMRFKLKGSLERQLAEETARKELIAHVSHDLRTPIAVIRGYAEGLRDGVAATPEMRARYLATIVDRSVELERLIAQLFAYSTLALDEPVVGTLDLQTELLQLCQQLGADFPDHRFMVEIPDGVVAPILMPSGQLRRVLANLADNSARHGGRDHLDIVWQLGVTADAVELMVSDNGVGVAAIELERIFDPFFQVDRARTMGSGINRGSGLGLAIVRKIVETAGGTVSAGLADGGGLAVRMQFPRGVQS